MTSWLQVVLLGTVVGLAACVDPVNVPTSASSAQATNGRTGADHTVFVTIPRFAVSIPVSGDLRPGKSIEIVSTTRALLASTDVHVEVRAPEVEAAHRSAWDAGFRAPVRETISPLTSGRASLAAGGEDVRRAALSIPAPGYYRVVASARATSAQRVRTHPYTESYGSSEIWLWLSEDGGKVTDFFDPSLFADSMIQQPGPFRYRKSVPRAQASDRAWSRSPGERIWEVVFYDEDPVAYIPLGAAKVLGSEGPAGEEQTPINTVTNAAGIFSTGCDTELIYGYDFEVKAENDYIKIQPNTVVATNGSSPSGCDDQQIIALSSESHVYSNMWWLGPEAGDVFGQSRDQVDVRINTSHSQSEYSYSGDSIIIKTVWEDPGAEGQVHEYGHAYHHHALGGAPPSIANCSEHGLPVYTSLTCAYTEGFAEYFAAVLRGPGVSLLYSDIENGSYLLTNPNPDENDPNEPDGTVIEGAVAALLLDITDGAVEAHDSIQYPGTYAGSLVKTCFVNDGSGSVHAAGIDHFIRCLEQQVDSTINSYFYYRNPASTAYSESASEPGDWSLSRIRKAWKKNLFNQ